MRAATVEDQLRPTPERASHDPVERVPDAIADERGASGQPFRALDVLARMERHGSITPAMRQAGECFRDDFILAHFEALRSADMGRVPSRGEPTRIGGSVMAARERVWQAVKMLGGLTSPCGCCAWHVLGLQETLMEWAVFEGWRGRPVHQSTASGLLIGALGLLEHHYRLDSRCNER